MVVAKTRKILGCCVMVRNGTLIKDPELLCRGKSWGYLFGCLFGWLLLFSSLAYQYLFSLPFKKVIYLFVCFIS